MSERTGKGDDFVGINSSKFPKGQNDLGTQGF
jgi:hypothetical protein